MADCIFCKIIDGEIPSYTVYEDDVVKAFLDISQTTPGHTLLVPKQHIANIYEYDEQQAAAVMERLPKVARAIRNSNPKIKGLNIINNNGELAYQSVMHSHFHLIPRYTEDDSFSIHFTDNSAKYDNAKYQQLADSIQDQMEG